jgi:hypothetical protein
MAGLVVAAVALLLGGAAHAGFMKRLAIYLVALAAMLGESTSARADFMPAINFSGGPSRAGNAAR